MQYESYHGKVKKVAVFLGKVYAHKTLILITLAALTLVISAMIAAKGFIVAETKCPAEQVYGEKQKYRAYAFLGRVTYEYCEQGSDEWSTERPILPGQYRVRAMCTSASGEPRYGGTYDYTLLPREITPTVTDTRILYGEIPRVEADLARGDRMSFVVQYESLASTTTNAWVDAASLMITDKEGNDRRACYVITETPETRLTFTRRPLKVTVQDASKIYDDRRLSFDGYEISEGTLAAGDRLIAVFTASITDVGKKENVPSLRIYQNGGMDVTHLYTMDVQSGTLTVEKRPLIIQTGSISYIYAGYELDYPKYTIDASTSLVSGHYLEMTDTTRLLDCGSVDNVLYFTIRNSSGGNEDRNYSLFVEPGTLRIAEREVTVHTADGSLVYNGEYQALQDVTVEHGAGDTVRVTQSEGLRDVGSGLNKLTVAFYRGSKDVTSNYRITYSYGTLTIDPRPITVQINDAQKIYDETPLVSERFTVSNTPYGLAKGHTLSLETEGSVVFGTAENRYVEGTARVVDAERRDVTANYIITVQAGTLRVNPRPLTVVTLDGSKVYDGDPCRNNGFRIESGTLLAGHVLEVYTTGSQTEAGESPNTVRQDLTKIRDTANPDADVMQYYAITYREGTLTVTPRPITVATYDYSWVYDGTAHSHNQIYVKRGTLVKDHELLSVVGSAMVLTDVGMAENIVEAMVFSGDRSVTHNYEIAYEYGTLEIRPRPIVVRTPDGLHTYDAQPYAAVDCMLDTTSTYALPRGHSLRVKAEDVRTDTNAGTYSNIQTVEVYSSVERRYVTENYEISYVYGTTVIFPRLLTVQILGSKMYDGTPLLDWEASPMDGTSLCPGHTITLHPLETLTEVGEIYPMPDPDTLSISDGHEDVLPNYVVTLAEGHLTVTPRVISVQSADAVKTYDGIPLTAPYGTVTEDSLALVEGHSLQMAVTGSALEPGRYINTRDPDSVWVMDENGQDITYNYQIDSIEEGTLTVRYPVTVTVTTGSASKLYDGLPLTCNQSTVEVTEGTLPAGYRVSVNVTGSICGAGAVENTAEVTVLDAYGMEVTDLVTVEVSPGILTVYPENPTDAISFGRVFADLDGILYLRMASYGDFDGRNWAEAPDYSGTLPQGYGYHYLTGLALRNMQYRKFTLQFADMASFMMPYYAELGGPAPVVGSDTDYRDHSDTDYISTYYYAGSGLELLEAYNRLSEADRSRVLGSYAIRERIYRSYVHTQYLNVDRVSKAYLKTVIHQEGFSADDPDVIAKVAAYIQNAASYNLQYDPALDSADNTVVAFLRDYKEGVCRHYATAATLLYRTLGIPARYTTGFMLSVRAGEWVEVETPGHAWVEVYIDGLGWVQVEVTGSDNGGDDPAVTEPVRLDVAPVFGWKEYDGTPLYASEELVLTPELEALLEQGYTYSVITVGSQQDIGESESRIVSFVLYDPDGVDVTRLFEVVKHTGILRVTAPAVEVFLYPMEKIYDGQAAVWTVADYEVLSLPNGVSLELTMCITRTDVGFVTLSDIQRGLSDYVTYRLMRNGRDVTAEYALVFRMPEGMEEVPVLTVKPRDIVLTAASETRADNGEPLQNSTAYISKGTLVAGHTLTASTRGEQMGVGSSENRVDMDSVTIVDANGDSVLHNYRITAVSGRLTVVEDE